MLEAQPPPPQRAMMLADLNVDPPESDGEDHPPTPKPNPAIAAAAVAAAAAAPVVAVESSTRYEHKVRIRSDYAGLLLLVGSCPLQIVSNWAFFLAHSRSPLVGHNPRMCSLLFFAWEGDPTIALNFSGELC